MPIFQKGKAKFGHSPSSRLCRCAVGNGFAFPGDYPKIFFEAVPPAGGVAADSIGQIFGKAQEIVSKPH